MFISTNSTTLWFIAAFINFSRVFPYICGRRPPIWSICKKISFCSITYIVLPLFSSRQIKFNAKRFTSFI